MPKVTMNIVFTLAFLVGLPNTFASSTTKWVTRNLLDWGTNWAEPTLSPIAQPVTALVAREMEPSLSFSRSPRLT